MDKLLAYLNGLSPRERDDFAQRCNTTIGYLRKACSVKQRLSDGMCLRISAESKGAVSPESLRPDVDWDYMRVALATADKPANQAQAAIKNVAEQGV